MAKKTEKSKKSNSSLWVWAVIGLVVVAGAAFFLTNPNGGTTQALAKEINPSQAAQMRDEGALMVDVREQSEWDAGHIPGAVLIPLGELPSRLNEVPKDRDIVVVCRSGNRSASGRDILLNAGYPQVTSMGGGMNQWASAGLPVVTGP